jgi:outer membrane protein OmpA-like peptidoglycan-associated protein
MRRYALVHRITVLTFLTAALVSSGCSTRNFTRNEVRALETTLSTRLEADEKNIAMLESNAKEMADHIGTVEKRATENTAEIGRVRGDVKNLNGEITKVDAKANDATTAARNAQSGVDKTNAGLSSLEESFRNRNNYDLVSERQILFPFNSSRLSEDSQQPLTEVATQLKENPDMFIVLEGRTDSSGDAAYNIQLGEKRNEAVNRFLVVSQGVPMYKVFQTSFGKDQPIAANDSREGREKNRTVVLRLYRARSAVSAR